MEKNKNIITESIGDIFRSFSISVNITVYATYLLFLLFCIFAKVGLQFINIILAILTALFMVAYLYLRLSGRKNRKRVRQIKKYYKNIRLAARLVIAVTALYSLVAATDSGSPLALIIALLGVVFITIRIFVELFLYFIKSKIREIKDSVKGSIEARLGQIDERISSFEDSYEAREEKAGRSYKSQKSKGGRSDDIFISVDDCILSDMEDF